MHEDPGRVAGRQPPVVTTDLDVAEPVDRVAGLELLARLARPHDVVDLAERQAVELEVRGRDPAVVVEGLAVAQLELGAGGAQVRQPEPAVDVLAEVDHLTPVTDLGHSGRVELLHPTHGRGR